MLQRIAWTTVPRAAIDHDVVIVTKLTNTESFTFDVIDVVRSGLSDCTSHPYPENHTGREAMAPATVESTVVVGRGGAGTTQGVR